MTDEYFRDDGRTLDGYSSHCNICKPIKTSYYIEHRDQVRQKQLEWNDANREYKNKYNRKYKEENWDAVRGWDKEWEIENLNHRKEYKSEFIQENLEYFREYNKKRRVEKKHEFGKEEWERCKTFFDNSCAYCGVSQEDHMNAYSQDLHKEHSDPKGSNGIDNCVPSCRSCNSSKRDKHFLIWYNEKNNRYSIERMRKILQWLVGEHNNK